MRRRRASAELRIVAAPADAPVARQSAVVGTPLPELLPPVGRRLSPPYAECRKQQHKRRPHCEAMCRGSRVRVAALRSGLGHRPPSSLGRSQGRGRGKAGGSGGTRAATEGGPRPGGREAWEEEQETKNRRPETARDVDVDVGLSVSD
eukprot:scaffold226296_cov26-Tisochrysis_lutea.AAC.1